ncbi:MAG: ATP synthase F1 subunit gamma [Candidatus Latescibacterota bacterium]|nr:ATP synthase F1 subunit gamma [Candidatus Latescibacterota bacterium]
MATLRQLRTRVGSISNIQRVTNAMQMVAAAKMRRAQDAIEAARPYAQHLDALIGSLRKSVDPVRNPVFADRPVERAVVVVVTADRGLCGAFNGSICRRVQSELDKYTEESLELITVGRKGYNYFRSRDFEVQQNFSDVFRDLEFSRASEIARSLTARFLSGEVDRVLLAFSEFQSVAKQIPAVHQLLPILPVEEDDVNRKLGTDYVFEPSPEQLLSTLVPRHVNFQVWRSLLEVNAGFFAAQMTAMDNATKNAGELLDDLTREMNKVRQSSITLELMDIIGGAEAVA